jgi:hypothetical protein
MEMIRPERSGLAGGPGEGADEGADEGLVDASDEEDEDD